MNIQEFSESVLESLHERLQKHGLSDAECQLFQKLLGTQSLGEDVQQKIEELDRRANTRVAVKRALTNARKRGARAGRTAEEG